MGTVPAEGKDGEPGRDAAELLAKDGEMEADGCPAVTETGL